MKAKIMYVSIFVMCLSVNVFAGEKISLAVYNFNANEVNPVLADSVADFIQTSLYKTGRFNLVERKNIGKILKEQAFQKTGCTSTECAVEVGRILNVGSIITGTVSKAGQMYVISMQLVDVEKGDIVLSDKIECDSEDMLNAAASVLAAHFSKGVTIRGEVVKIINENEIIINLGAGDGIEKGQELSIERLGEGVKDKNGTVIYQKRIFVAKVEATDVSEAASNFKLNSKKEDIKEGDIIEIKKEKLGQLEPLKKPVETKNEGEYEHLDIFYLYYCNNISITNGDGQFSPVGSVIGNTGMRNGLGVEYGGNFFGGNFKWLTDIYVAFSYTASSSLDMPQPIQLWYATTSFGLNFYPLTTILNPGYLNIKNGREQRGWFAPYIGIEPCLYIAFLTDPNLTGVEDQRANHMGLGYDLKIGADILNIAFVEIFWEFRAPISFSYNDSRGVATKPLLLDLSLGDTTGICAGIRF